MHICVHVPLNNGKKVKYNLFLNLICCIFMVPECLWHRNVFDFEIVLN